MCSVIEEFGFQGEVWWGPIGPVAKENNQPQPSNKDHHKRQDHQCTKSFNHAYKSTRCNNWV